MGNKVVTLTSFLGTAEAKKSTEDPENYWRLIGQKGEVIDAPETSEQVLVLFKNLDSFKVENHNPIKNSLWIKKSDLKFEL